MTSLAIIATSFTLWAIVTALCCYRSNVAFWVKASAFVALISTGLTSYNYYEKTLGAPIEGAPDYEFVYVGHEISGDEFIILTVFKIEDETYRLHKYPYSREEAKKLAGVEEKSKKGKKQKGKPREKDSSKSTEFSDFDPPSTLAPKG